MWAMSLARDSVPWLGRPPKKPQTTATPNMMITWSSCAPSTQIIGTDTANATGTTELNYSENGSTSMPTCQPKTVVNCKNQSYGGMIMTMSTTSRTARTICSLRNTATLFSDEKMNFCLPIPRRENNGGPWPFIISSSSAVIMNWYELWIHTMLGVPCKTIQAFVYELQLQFVTCESGGKN